MTGNILDLPLSPSPAAIERRTPDLGPIERLRSCVECHHPRGWHSGGRGECFCKDCTRFARTLMDAPRADSRRSDPPASAEAAERTRIVRRGQAARLLAAIRATPGLRARDLAQPAHLDVVDVRKRASQLRNGKLVRNQSGTMSKGEELRWYPA